MPVFIKLIDITSAFESTAAPVTAPPVIFAVVLNVLFPLCTGAAETWPVVAVNDINYTPRIKVIGPPAVTVILKCVAVMSEYCIG